MYMTPEELAKERPETLRRYMQMGDKSPLPLGAVRMAMLLQDRIKMNAQAKQAQAQGNGNPNKPTTIVDRIAEAVKQKIQSEPSPQQMAGIGAVPIPNVMQEQNFAGGGIVAFAKGKSVSAEEAPEELAAPTPVPATASVSPSLQRRLEEDLKRIENERRGLGSVDPYTSEELSSMYGKEYSAAEERTKPFLERMRALEEKGRPDIARMQEDTEGSARRRAISELFQTRGRGIGAALAGVGRSMGSYEDEMQRGVASVAAAKKAHVASEKLMVQAEMEANKGNAEAARRLVDAANAAKKTEVAENRNAKRDLGRQHSEVVNIYEANARAEQLAAATAQREAASQRQFEAMMARVDATTKLALARMGGGGGGGKMDAMYKLVEGAVLRLSTDNNFMESAKANAQRAAKAAGIDRKSPEYGAFVENNINEQMANAARRVAIDIPNRLLERLPSSLKPPTAAPTAPTAAAPAVPTPGIAVMDSSGNFK